MKILPCLLLLLLVCPVFAKDPDELAKLRNIYDSSVKNAFQKVGRLYHEQLVELKKNYMEALNLEAAVAVDNEIKKIKERHGNIDLKDVVTASASSLDGAWVVHAHGKTYLFVFNEEKVADDRGKVWKWAQKNGGIVATREDGHYHEIKLDPTDPNLMVGLSSTGAKLTYKRLKW